MVKMRAVGLNLIAAYLMLVAVYGCSNRPPTLKPPKFDGEDAGIAAMKQYDTDGDGVVGGDELNHAPSLNFALDRLDEDQDDCISAAEVTRLIDDKWKQDAAGVIRIKCVVELDGKPLDGATVTFDPENFLGEGIVYPASGVTRAGLTTLSVATENLVHPNARGVAPGLYLVRISKVVDGEETIPARYNTATTLGVEVARRASYMPGSVNFELRSR